MPEALAAKRVRNMFFIVTVFSCFLLLALIFEASLYLSRIERSDRRSTDIQSAVSLGSALWEKYDCIGCHTLLGRGAYFAPELGDLYTRYNGNYSAIRDLIKRPLNFEGRRIMPKYDLTERELRGLVELFKYTSTIRTPYWPLPQ